MATQLQCHECANRVSSNAKACPQCGAKIKKPHSKVQWVLIGLATVGIVSCISNAQTEAERDNAKRAAAEAQKSPEQRIAESAEKVKRQVEFQRVVAGAKALKAASKNPDSFKLEGAALMDSGSICYTYRAANSFNAIVPGQYVITKKGGSSQAGDWNKYCGSKSGTDYTYVKHEL